MHYFFGLTIFTSVSSARVARPRYDVYSIEIDEDCMFENDEEFFFACFENEKSDCVVIL